MLEERITVDNLKAPSLSLLSIKPINKYSSKIQKEPIISINIRQFGGVGDLIELKDGSITSNNTLLESASASFSSKDIGKAIYVNGAGLAGATLIANISDVRSISQVILSVKASQTVSKATVTYGTDNSEAFIKMNAYARSLSPKPIRLQFERGKAYMTRFNNWLSGIKSIEVVGQGASIMCTEGAHSPAEHVERHVALATPSAFENVNTNYFSSYWSSKLTTGCFIKSTRKGAQSVTLSQPDSVASFRVGNWVLIYGLDQEGVNGFPVSPRYFDYAKVKAINSSTGVITLDRLLTNQYDSGWMDGKGAGELSAPRILNLNRPSFNTIENLVIKDLTFLPFKGNIKGPIAADNRNGRIQIYGVINSTLINVTAPNLYIGQGKTQIYQNCHFTVFCEGDKIADTVRIINSTFKDFTHCNGVNFLLLRGNTFTGKFDCNPRMCLVVGNTFSTIASNSSRALAGFAFNAGTRSIELGDNTWNCSRLSANGSLLAGFGSTTLTVEQVRNDSTITLLFANWTAKKNMRQVAPGYSGTTSTGKQLTVNRVFKWNTDTIAVQGVFSDRPAVGDAFVFSFAPKVVIKGNQIREGATVNSYKTFAQ
ncbi:hypothetical protein GO730_35035 [Spirosoma sp. HMF3257]|uniref:Uncharacterized protein n=1 Tax=Spirosoma telluris TaxID=2183553 RepID=A0A327NRX2_9BACT|nr:hypothetical protein [Spirosoma telluris]RAI77997.1 hypothetical protein HMF3257_34935 [Spirosoma telluris]